MRFRLHNLTRQKHLTASFVPANVRTHAARTAPKRISDFVHFSVVGGAKQSRLSFAIVIC